MLPLIYLHQKKGIKMQFYISEKEQVFLTVQASKIMSSLEAEMLQRPDLSKFEEYKQWHDFYLKICRKSEIRYIPPKTPAVLMNEISNNDKKQLKMFEKNESNKNS